VEARVVGDTRKKVADHPRLWDGECGLREEKMASYLLTYDLNNSKDYQKLYDELERLGGHRTLYSVWLVSVDNTAVELRKHLTKFIDADDSMWVLEVTHNNSYNNVRKGTNAWLTNNPPYR